MGEARYTRQLDIIRICKPPRGVEYKASAEYGSLDLSVPTFVGSPVYQVTLVKTYCRRFSELAVEGQFINVLLVFRDPAFSWLRSVRCKRCEVEMAATSDNHTKDW